MHSKPEALVANDRNYNLFVRLPTARTVTLRHLCRQVTLAEIRDRLEVVAGLPCQIYDVSLAGGQILNESAKLNFGHDLRNGAILKTSLHPHFEALFNTIKDNVADPDVLYNLIVGTEDSGPAQKSSKGGRGSRILAGRGDGRSSAALLEDLSNAERCSIMLYLACHFGHYAICKILLKFDPEGAQRVTCFGRTPLHAAAANDQLKVVQLLLTAGAPLSPQDAFGKTPLEYAKANHACTCERNLRYRVLSSARESQPEVSEQHPVAEDEAEEELESVGAEEQDLEDQRNFPKQKEEMARLRIKVKGATLTPREQQQQQQQYEASQAVAIAGHPVMDITNSNSKSGKKKVYWESSTNSITVRRTGSATSATNSRTAVAEPNYASSNHPKTASHDGRACSEAAAIPSKPATADSGGAHARCAKGPNFVAVRRVPLEEQRLVTMEFTPLEKPITHQADSLRPKSKVEQHHAWAEKVVRSKVEGKDQGEKHCVQHGVKSRTKSAQYYKTKYHPRDESTDYRERPATAGPRFRFWKTWMLEKLETDAIKERMEAQDADRRLRNMAAYRRWLARKEREEARNPRHLEESSDSSDDEDDANLGYGNWPSPREMAFKNWLESKRGTIVAMARRRQQEQEARQNGATGAASKDIYNRRLTIFEIGCTDPTPIRQPPTEKYIGAYRTWQAKKKKYEAWKKKNNVRLDMGDGQTTEGDIDAAKYTLFMEGMTYEEWLGMKEREAKLDKSGKSD